MNAQQISHMFYLCGNGRVTKLKIETRLTNINWSSCICYRSRTSLATWINIIAWQRFLVPCQFEIVNPGILISSTVRSRQWTLQAFGFHLSTSWQCNAVSKLTEEAKWHRSLWRQAVLYTSRRRCRDKFSLEFLLIWPPNGKISIRWYLSLPMFNSILFSIFFSFAQNIMCIKFEWFYNII